MQLAAGGGGEATAGVSGDAAPCARGQVGGSGMQKGGKDGADWFWNGQLGIVFLARARKCGVFCVQFDIGGVTSGVFISHVRTVIRLSACQLKNNPVDVFFFVLWGILMGRDVSRKHPPAFALSRPGRLISSG